MAIRTRSIKKSRFEGKSPVPRHDAVTLLEENHRTLRRLMSRFARSRDAARSEELAQRICSAAAIHARLEEEILAPAFLACADESQAHHRAEVTRTTCIMMIASFGGPDMRGTHLHARMKILAEVIRRHMLEEEQPGGFFAAVRAAGMDLQAMGQCMRLRRYLLQNGSAARMRSRTEPAHRRQLQPLAVAAAAIEP
jgi:stress-induced morphogen